MPILLHGIEKYVLYIKETKTDNYFSGNVVYLKNQSVLDSRHVYVGDVITVHHVLKTAQLDGEVLIICSTHCKDYEPVDNYPNVTLVMVDMDAIDLLNRVSENVHNFNIWYNELHSVVNSSQGLDKLLEVAFRMLNKTILLLNAGYKKIAVKSADGYYDPKLEELQNQDYLSFDTICKIEKESASSYNPESCKVEYVSSQTGYYNIIRLIKYRGNIVARLCILLDSNKSNPYISDLSDILAKMVQNYLLSGKVVDYTANTEFGSLVSDLIECRLTDPEELEERLKLMPLAVKKYYHVVIVSFRDKNQPIPWNYVISQLEQVFPFSNITIYKGEILLLIRKPRHENRLSVDNEKLYSILEYYDGYAGVGNFSKWLTSLRPLYFQAKAALRLGCKIRENKEQRIFYYEDFSTYHIIELAAETCKSNIGGNLVYMCCPALIALERYDKKFNNNLKEVLYCYLKNERNSSKTARELHIHRNTMQYKINKIEEIIGQSLDDPILRQRMMFSYQVIQYSEKFLNEDLLVLKRNTLSSDTT